MFVYLSHVLETETPCFRNTREVVVTRTRDLEAGAPVNNHRFQVGAHNGTHVDAPFHFVRGGRTVESYEAAEWVFTRPALMDVPKGDSELLQQADLEPFVARVTRLICCFCGRASSSIAPRIPRATRQRTQVSRYRRRGFSTRRFRRAARSGWTSSHWRPSSISMRVSLRTVSCSSPRAARSSSSRTCD
jgi:hypothetical protein